MEKKSVFLGMILLGGLMVSCYDESELLLPAEEEVAVWNKPAWEEQRGLSPRAIVGAPQTNNNDHSGEKGRDRRDNIDWYDQNLAVKGIMQRSVGSMYIESYDVQTDEYVLKFYWGDSISEETRLANDNKHVILRFPVDYWNNPGAHLLSYKGSAYLYFSNGWIFQVSDLFYYLDDSFRVPRCIVEGCEKFEISFYVDASKNNERKWTQRVEDLLLEEYGK